MDFTRDEADRQYHQEPSMTVAQLISELQKLPPDKPIYVAAGGSWEYTCGVHPFQVLDGEHVAWIACQQFDDIEYFVEERNRNLLEESPY